MSYYGYDNFYLPYDTKPLTAKDVQDILKGWVIGSDQVEEGSIEYFHLGKGSIGEVHIREASINHAHIQNLAVGRGHIQHLAVGTAQIDDLAVTNAKIKDLDAEKITTGYLDADRIKANSLTADHIDVSTIIIGEANIEDASITRAKIVDASIGTAQIEDASITQAKIKLAGVDRLIVGRSNIAELAVGDAHIESVSANKLFAGTIDTSKVSVASANNRLLLSGDKFQIFDLDTTGQYYERIFLGVDEFDNASLVLRGSDGQTVLLNQDGLTEAGFTDGYNRVGDNSLDPIKIDINRFITRINEDGTTQIDGSRIVLDEASLDVTFSQMTEKIEEHETTLGTHASQIEANATAISLRVTETQMRQALDDVDERIADGLNTISEEYRAYFDLEIDSVVLGLEETLINTETNIMELVNSQLSLTIDEFNIMFNEFQTGLDEEIDNLNQISSYFRFSPTGLEIGQTDSPFHIHLDNQELGFYDSGNKVAYVNGQKMYITQAEVLESLIVGVHRIDKYNNELTLVQWVGED